MDVETASAVVGWTVYLGIPLIVIAIFIIIGLVHAKSEKKEREWKKNLGLKEVKCSICGLNSFEDVCKKFSQWSSLSRSDSALCQTCYYKLRTSYFNEVICMSCSKISIQGEMVPMWVTSRPQRNNTNIIGEYLEKLDERNAPLMCSECYADRKALSEIK